VKISHRKVTPVVMMLAIVFFAGSIIYKNNNRFVDNIAAKTQEDDVIEKAYLSSMGGVEGFGVAKRIYQNGLFVSTINVNLPRDSNATYWTYFIEKSTNEKIFIGELIDGGDEYILIYRADRNLAQYRGVEVEQISADGTKNLVLKGSF
jgi:hypothetical protein